MYPSKEYLESIKKKLEEMNLADGRPASPGDIKKHQMDINPGDFLDALGSSAIRWMEKNRKNPQ